MTTQPISVLCVEDNPLVAEAIGRKLAGNSEFKWLGCVDTTEALMAKVAAHLPQVVCMDLDIPGQDTMEMIRRLRESYEAVRVLILTGHVRADLIDQVIDAGAWGYVSKAAESRIIVESIRRVAAGEFVLGDQVRSAYDAERASATTGSMPPPPVVTVPETTRRGRFGFLSRNKRSGV